MLQYQIIVSGAGMDTVNGIYNQSGQEWGKACFVHSSGEYKLCYDAGDDPTFWVIVCVGDDDFMGLYHTDEVPTSGPLPPLSGWVAYHAARPAPVIAHVAV